ncbi:MAG: FkbM family methyltransferase [Novosphingobium sp.]|nr:FkbM family methyltransferase [Novosphingobium sp.]
MKHFTLSEILPDYTDFGPIAEKPDRMSGVYLGEKTVFTRLWTGHTMMVYTGDMIVMPHLINLGINEPHITRTLVSLTRPGDRFVDVGANVGYFSVLGGWRSYPGGEVWSFEPNPNIYPILASNVTNNGFAHCSKRRRLALSDQPGVAQLRIFKGYEATSTIRDVSEAFVTHTREETGHDSYLVDVEVDTLDAQMAAVPSIDVMKIDVEGHELSMIKGAVEILRRSPTVKIVMEFVPPILGAGPALELVTLIRSLGFTIYRIEHDGTFTLEDQDASLVATTFADLLLIRQAS